MKSMKPLEWAGIALGVSLLLYFSHRNYFGDINLLGGVLLLEIIIASIWKYSQRFFVLLVIAFVWAGLRVPLEGAWTIGRWVVLATGAFVGFIVWTRAPRKSSGSLHLIAFFCICAAFASATVSPFIQMAFLKALSLFLLFLYCSTGARLAVLGREGRFFQALLLGSEITVYVTAMCYLGLGSGFWGNPNSLGAAMSVGLFPILLWGWLTSDAPGVKIRRLAALLLCAYLVWFSMERAGMATVAIVTVIFCVCLRQYKLLVKVVALVMFVVAVSGMLDPSSLNRQFGDMEDALLYKGHKEEGFMGSRQTPWNESIASIKEHPWFGTGYGTSPTGKDPGLYFGTVRSSAETAREHGSSYITIVEWVGMVGMWPFAALLGVTVANVWKVCAWMSRTADPRHYSIPMAMVVLAGLVHASFEDWLFAVGSYLCLFFWSFGFMLADFIPGAVEIPLASTVRSSRPSPAAFGAFVSNR